MMTTDMRQDGLGLDNPNESKQDDGPVECLGKTFENDKARRDYYLGLLTEKLKDPEFRKIEGFPIGEDEDILELSDPPYYTACPNPFIEDFINHYGKPYDPEEEYKREPYAADVSEGKNDPVYNAHSYHTKVPHKAIMRYILHYTNPGDVVFDGFCGTGMTGVAAQMCGDKATVESLGYKVLKNGKVLEKAEENEWREISMLGSRVPILSDLSPLASFVASQYNSYVDQSSFIQDAGQVLKEVRDECAWMYETSHEDNNLKGEVVCVVWSDVFNCPECIEEIVLWESGVDKESGKVKDSFPCPTCNSKLSKRLLNKSWSEFFDQSIGKTVRQAKQVPVLIVYSVKGKRFNKVPDESDIQLINKINEINIPYWHPISEILTGDKTGEPIRIGVTNSHHYYTKRNLYSLSCFLDKLKKSNNKRLLRFQFDSLVIRQSKRTRLLVSYFFHGGGGWIGTPLSGNLYIPSFNIEVQPFSTWQNRISKTLARVQTVNPSLAFCGSATSTNIPDSSLDYIFLDPPFGANLQYSELNFLWESWLNVFTNMEKEAVENRTQNKGANDYRKLMFECFQEAYRVLKPGRWLTVEFSNTNASVWNSIQTALSEAGFIVASVAGLDKKQGSFNAVTNSTSVKQDLVISSYKPNGGFEERFEKESDEEGVWDFIRTHLGYLPLIKKENDTLVKVPERDPRILFDQVVAYFVRNLRDVPLSSKEFQAGLLERFAERDSMIFLPEQVAEYDKARMTSKQLKQLTIFVDDEASAIEWLRQLLNERPQSFQDVHPKFINELSGWKKSEAQLELLTLLEQSFIKYDGEGPLPPQIHSYLSTNFKDMRNLSKDDSKLIKKAKDRWYVPNPEREEDLLKLRERDLLKQFNEYKTHTGRKLKTVRLEAVRCGFKKAWRNRDYATIIQVAEKIPQKLLQEDQKLLMWYDQAQTRHSDENLF